LAEEQILDEILVNIISNAIKYAPENSTVTVNRKARNRRYIQLSVQDEGPGIDPALHTKIFEKFYRIKNDQVYEVKGTGLGLYMVRYFLQLLDGMIYVDGTSSKGALFHILLPRRKISFGGWEDFWFKRRMISQSRL